jgi:hypothetical protein
MYTIGGRIKNLVAACFCLVSAILAALRSRVAVESRYTCIPLLGLPGRRDRSAVVSAFLFCATAAVRARELAFFRWLSRAPYGGHRKGGNNGFDSRTAGLVTQRHVAVSVAAYGH